MRRTCLRLLTLFIAVVVTSGSYNLLSITSSNAMGFAAQGLPPTNQTPAITSANSATFTEGLAASFTLISTGFPAPTLSETGSLPNTLTFNAATGVLSGTPGFGTAGTYNITLSAANGSGSTSQNFTLTVSQGTPITAPFNVLTVQNDNGRTGANLNETALTTSNVNVSQFGKLFSRSVDGYIFAQPLYVADVSIPNSGIHNVVYVATMNNSVYAFDADRSTATAPLWQTSLGPPVPTNDGLLPAHASGAGFAPEYGILSTPVIDPNTKTLYAVALTLTNGNPLYQLHALDITTGQEKSGSPEAIQASASGTGYDSINGIITFNTNQQLQRAGLLLANGSVYMAFASYGDQDPYHGWILGYDETTLQQTAVLNVSPQSRGGIWQSGGGLASDANGFVYAVTGNGDWDGIINFSESALKLNPSLSVADWFTPYNYAYLNTYDLDLGSCRPLLVPGTNSLVTGGKEGTLYVLSTGSLGHQVSGNTQIAQSFRSDDTSGIFSGLAYWNNSAGPLLYVWGGEDYLQAYRFADGQFTTEPVSTSSVFADTGTALSVSANGSTPGTGIVWAYTPDSPAGSETTTGTLRAFDASDVSNELWDSGQNPSRDSAGTFAKFAAPTVANGKVYLSTFSNQLVVYGLLPSAPVSVSPQQISLSALDVQLFTANTAVNWSINPSVGTITPGGLYTAPALIATAQTVTVTATSVADSTQSASATVNLIPVAVTVSPSTSTLFASQTQQFGAAVIGSNDTAVSWSINPSVGTITPDGLYSAPSSVTIAQTVTVTATSAADGTKSATASVTLSPPAPPVITQQPQSASIVAGQSATFAIAAAGTGLTYQWQSMTVGAGSFSSISGAVSNTYTTSPTAVSDTGTQFQCIVGNTQGSVTSSPAILTVLPAGIDFVTSTTLGTIRNNYTGWVGMIVTVGGSPLTVTSLGRMSAPGNAGTHVVKIVDASTGADVAGGSVSVNMAGGTTGVFIYGALATSVTLNANSSYYILSQETLGADQWYDWDTTAQTTTDAALAGAVYGTAALYTAFTGWPGRMYVPVDFKYLVPITVIVSPATPTLSASQTQQFTTTVTGTNNTAVTWSINSSVGAITSGGLYTAPAFVAAVQIVTVTATSSADNTRSGTATVTLTPVAVTVSPPTPSLFASQTQQFTATVTGTSNSAVTWSVNPNVGTITAAGLYTAPASVAAAQTVTVTATSGADNTKSATAMVSLTPVAVTVSPSTSTLLASQTQQLTATVTGTSNTTIVWSINPSVGTISSGGLYTAPTSVTVAQTVTVTAASAADSTKSATATITLSPPAPPIITQQPQSTSVAAGQSATFTISASGAGLTYQWQSMAPGAGSFSSISGAVSSSYTTAPTSTSNTGTQFQCLVANSEGTVTSSPAPLTVLSASVNFVTSKTLGTIRNNYTGWVGMNVTIGPSSFTVTSLGRIFAPGNTGTHLVKIVNASTGADVPGGSVSVNMSGGTAGAFVYAPLANSITLNANTSYYILSQETLGGDQWYDWNTTALTTNDATLSSAVYGTASPYTTIAGWPGHMYVPVDFQYIPPVAVKVSPLTPTLFGSQTQQFTATVTGTNNTAVSWSINPTVGTITAGGLYTAPALIAAAQTVIVTATSTADNTKLATATVTLTPVAVTVGPATPTLFASQTEQFTATVIGTSNTAVTWSINPTVGTITAGGLYTAPALIAAVQTITVTATSTADSTKSATATITLSPPAPPVITQQPQNSSVIAGQSATFTITAIGTGVTYQWQSMPVGAGTFDPIPGAVSSTYTTGATTASDTGTQFQCVVGNNQGGVTSSPATLTVLPASVDFVASTTLGTIRNNYSGWVGMSVAVGASPITVTSLGRIFAPGNTGTHLVKIVNASTGADVAGGSVSISMTGGTAGAFVYGALAASVTLNANTSYYILSQEAFGGDQWYDLNTTAQTTADATLTGPVYGGASPYVASGSASRMYVPVDFKYLVPVAVTVSPATPTLFASQGQQFTATVTGSSNTTVSWSMNPSVGTITSGGLYTAPALIMATQTITVTATSAADGTQSATATITLSPPAPPTITQQPQSVSVVSGQSATFSVTAVGIGLTYQWQSMPSGGVFAAIPGATASSYTTPATAIGDSGTEFLCIVTSSQGSIASAAGTLTVVPSGTSLVVSSTLGTLRNNFTGWVGLELIVGNAPLQVTSVGRIFVNGNTGSHMVKLVSAATGLDVPGGAALVSGGTAGTFSYAPLAAPVTLNANGVYYLLSQETAGGDQWYDNNTTVKSSAGAAISGAAYFGGPYPYTVSPNSANRSYVPVDLKY